MNVNQESKYNAIAGKIINRSTGKEIPEDEPIFIFRAKDKKSIVALQAYLDAVEDDVHKKVVQRRLNQFLEYQSSNPDIVKEPDSDAGLAYD